MGLHQIKKLLRIKVSNYQNEETTHRTEENLCQLFNRQRINILSIQRAQKSQTRKRTNNPINKWANKLDSSFQKKYKRLINI
jgi:hypothetical protein